jgi:hypothetical protein
MSELVWRKASECGSSECVEVAWHKAEASKEHNCVEVAWHKAQACASGECVEAGPGACGMIHVRDSKDREGPVLNFTRAEWAAFLDGARRGEFDQG